MRMTDIEPFHAIDRLTDRNPLSFFESKDTDCSIIYDLGKPYSINKIEFYPRNDDNFINPNEVYELLYNEGTKGWVSLGIKVAKSKSITFTAPHNALLWLKNHTTGIEEQVFIYTNKKQNFAHDITNNSIY